MTIGVLALQGGFAPHLRCFGAIGCPAHELRHSQELAGVDGLVIPGGESTTLLRLMEDEPWFEAIGGLERRGGALLGTCAGAILLAREVKPAQASLGLLDVSIERNAWGRQAESFEATVDVPALGARLEAIFIRAPRLRRVGLNVEVLATHAGEPVLVRQGRVWAATFHAEVAGETRLHAAFAAHVQRAAA